MVPARTPRCPAETGLPSAGQTEGCELRPPKFEHRNGADSSSLACVLGKAWVAPRLLGVDAVAFSAGQFADGHLVGLGSAFDTAVTGGDQVVVPVERVAHVELLSFMSNSCRSRSRGMRWDRVMEGPAAVPGDQAFDLVLPC